MKLVVSSVLALALLLGACKHDAPSTTAAASSVGATKPSYTTGGTVKSFGPGRAYVNVEHDDIPGYMNRMTMSFEPRQPAQLEGMKEGDRIRFTFTDDDGRRLLDKIDK